MICKNCKKEPAKKYSKFSNGDFCSIECARSYSTQKTKNKKKKSNCTKCGKEIIVGNQAGICYCDDCKKNKLKKKIKTLEYKPVKFVCKSCGKEIEYRKKYCSDCIIERQKTRLKNNNYNYDYVLNWRNNNKKRAVDYLGGKCIICGYNKSLRSLDFHHLDPTKKEMTISKHLNKLKFEKLKTELDKCVLVCSNCHGEIHDGLVNMSACPSG